MATSPIASRNSGNSSPHILRFDPLLDDILEPNVRPQVLVDGFTFTEGPMWREGRLWFVDEEGDKVHAVTPEGHVSTLIDYKDGPYAKAPGSATASPFGATTGPNAMATAPDGTVVAMQQYARDVVKLIDDPANPSLPVKQLPFLSTYDGRNLNSPNDIVFAPDGSFFFSDPDYGLKLREKDPAKELPFQAIFRQSERGLHPVITDLATPNGVTLSPDHRTLYVNNSGPDQRVIAYALDQAGEVGPGKDVIAFSGFEGDGVPDGLKTDAAGNIWTTGPGGIRVLTKEGRVLGQISLPQVANNMAWGDDDFCTLYICAHSHIYTLRTLRPGTPPLFTRK